MFLHCGYPEGLMSESVFEGSRPTRDGEWAAESQGMAPIPEDARYGASWRNFTVWFAPNMQLSGVFVGTLAITLGLGFWSGFFAIVIGIILGALPVAYLTLWGAAGSPAIWQDHFSPRCGAVAQFRRLGRAGGPVWR